MNHVYQKNDSTTIAVWDQRCNTIEVLIGICVGLQTCHYLLINNSIAGTHNVTVNVRASSNINKLSGYVKSSHKF